MRPKAPAISTWAVGNYAAGPAWGGLPKRLAPVATEIIPGTGAGARVQNYLLGDLVDGVQGVLSMAGQMPALNVSAVGTTTNGLKRLAFSDTDQIWIGVGNGGINFVEASRSRGQSWTSLTGSMATALTLENAIFDGAGNIAIMASASRNMHEGARTAYGTWTWTTTANALGANPTTGACQLEYEPTAAKLVAVYRVGITGMRIDGRNSPIAGTAWTARTIPAAWTGYTGTNAPVIGQGGGVLVAAFPDAAAQKINIITSSDGGVTWSANIQVSSQALVAGYGGIDMSRPTYDAATGAWYLVISSSSGTNSTEVFSSSNSGASWTSVWYRSGAAAPIFLEVQALGSLLTAFEGSGLAAYSVDLGVTWRRVAALSGTANRLGVRAGGGMLMVTNSADKTISTSHRIGVSGVVL